MPPSFIDTDFKTKSEYDKWLASGGASAIESTPTLGYWKIRGLASGLRMMFFYKGQPFTNKAYGEDFKEKWFGGDKVELSKKNAMINLPYVIDGDKVVTQSNSCYIYLGAKLGIDKPELAVDNHQVLDQTMDLRNELMTICYGPKGKEFKPALEAHMEGATTHFKKLDGFCKGKYMCGDTIQSADFHVFEMVDQHVGMCSDLGLPFSIKDYPKLAALHAAFKAESKLATYFKSDVYTKYAYNNPNFTNYKGTGYKDPFGPTTSDVIGGAKAEKAPAKGPAQQPKQTKEEKAAKEAAKEAEKRKAKIIKEGGKKGVEIEGASDMGGLDFFCTTMELPEGNLDELELSMLAMNAEPDPEAEDRKGCSGHIGKMIYSAGVEQLAIVAYVPSAEFNKSADKVDVAEWVAAVLKDVGGEVTKPAFETTSVIPNKKTGSIVEGAGTGTITGKLVVAVCKSDPEKGKFALKDKDAAMASAFAFLRSHGAFPEDDGDDSDDMVFGDDDNLDDYE